MVRSCYEDSYFINGEAVGKKSTQCQGNILSQGKGLYPEYTIRNQNRRVTKRSKRITQCQKYSKQLTGSFCSLTMRKDSVVNDLCKCPGLTAAHQPDLRCTLLKTKLLCYLYKSSLELERCLTGWELLQWAQGTQDPFSVMPESDASNPPATQAPGSLMSPAGLPGISRHSQT